MMKTFKQALKDAWSYERALNKIGRAMMPMRILNLTLHDEQINTVRSALKAQHARLKGDADMLHLKEFPSPEFKRQFAERVDLEFFRIEAVLQKFEHLKEFP